MKFSIIKKFCCYVCTATIPFMALNTLCFCGNTHSFINASIQPKKFEYTHLNLRYRINSNGNVSITKCFEQSAQITIPEKIENKYVTFIAAGAFYRCSKLKTISLPSSVKYIGEQTFAFCKQLETVNFGPESQLISIGDFAFYNCSSLKFIYLPASVTNIGEGAFQFCKNLQKANIPSGSQLSYISDLAFCQCKKLNEIHIPTSVGYVSKSAFSKCTSLTIPKP